MTEPSWHDPEEPGAQAPQPPGYPPRPPGYAPQYSQYPQYPGPGPVDPSAHYGRHPVTDKVNDPQGPPLRDGT
ncbi:MAG TPA: hypothetical protein VGC05_01850 [Mycobacterium sp.]